MALDFPNAPTIGEKYPVTIEAGVPQYQWDGVAWMAAETPQELTYVKRAGDTMTGALTLPGNPTGPLEAATKQMVDTKLPIAGGTMTGNLTIGPTGTPPALTLTAGHGIPAYIIGSRNTLPRWIMRLCDETVEGGGNAGGNFDILRYDDAGNFIAPAFSLNRATGTATFGNINSASITATGNVAATGNVSAGGSVLSSSAFLATSANAVLAGLGGTIYLRPNGQGSGTGEATLDSAGKFIASMLSTKEGINGGLLCKTGHANTNSGNWANLFWNGNMQLYVDNTYVGQIAIASDYRVKKDVAALPSMWETIKALRPVKYTQADFDPPSAVKTAAKDYKPLFVADDKERWGFLAHEMQEMQLRIEALEAT